jgi:hypothetical protein
MKYNPLQIVLLAFAPLLVRTFLFYLACKIRSIHITLLSCTTLAGSGLLISIIPIPLPFVLTRGLAIGVSMFLMTRYTEAELYPDVIFIPLVVEILSSLVSVYLLAPLAI